MKNIRLPQRRYWLRLAALVLLLGTMMAQMAWSSRRKSAAFDEAYHLVSGYAYLHTGSPRLSWEHPPLPQVLAALPLIRRADMAPFPTQHPGWQEGNAEAFVDDYLWIDNAAIAPDLIWAGRKPLMWLALGFGMALFTALFTLAGEAAAWVGLVLFVFDPNILANGRFIGNDLAAAGFMFIAVWRLGMYFRRSTALNLVLTGLAAGLAIASKLTAAFLGPAFLLIALIYPEQKPEPTKAGVGSRKSEVRSQKSISDIRHPTSNTQSTQYAIRSTQLNLYFRRFLAMFAMALVAAFTLWAVFGFEIDPIIEDGIPVPAPTYLRGLPLMFQRVARGTPTFLWGRVSDTGWWYYFTVTFALKTPLPTLILLGIAGIRSLRNWRETSLWWIPGALYFLIASSSTLQIGYRYILPVLLFSIALAAGQFHEWPRARWARGGLALLGVWMFAEAAYVFPDHLAYSNLLAGGPDNTWRHFADMNVDWGMDLVALRDYAAAHPDEEIYLAYFGSAYPSAYAINARLLPGFSRVLTGPEYHAFNPYTPEPGTYAISATSLHLGLVYEGQDLYALFRNREPDARAGRSILIYRLTYPPDVPVDRAVVTSPSIWRHSPESLGMQEGHRLITKWVTSGAVVLPANGPAHYVIQRDIPDTAIVRDAVRAGDARPFLTHLPAPGAPTTPEGLPLALPAAFDGGPDLAGWEISATQAAPGDALTLVTYWRIDEALTPPLSVFVHLIGADGQAITQWDGWPVATMGLETGDVIALEHPLALPDDSAPGEYPLQVGIYRPPHGPRLPVAETDRVYLTYILIEE